MSDLVRKIGQEKLKNFQKETDYYLDFYKEKATKLGLKGDLKFKKEGPYMIIFVELNDIIEDL